MASLNLCTSLLFLCLARDSLQGGVKPQAHVRGSPYFPSLMRGTGGMRLGAGLGPAGVKAGKYPGYGTLGLSAGPGIPPLAFSPHQDGFGAGPDFGGYGASTRYGAGLGAYQQAGKQRSGYRGIGYPRTSLSMGGLAARGKSSKAGYGAGPSMGGYPGAAPQQAYPGAIGGYPGTGLQNGYGNGYGAAGAGFPGSKPSGYGTGVQPPYSSQLGVQAGDPSGAKYGGAGQLPYSGQPQQPDAGALAGDYGKYGAPQSPFGAQAGEPGGISVDPAAIKYGEPSQLPYGVQPAGLGAEGKPGPYGGTGQLGYGSQSVRTTGIDDDGNGIGYGLGDLQGNGLGAGAYGAGPAGYGGPLGYGAKDSKYGMSGFMGTGYRGRCPSGKC